MVETIPFTLKIEKARGIFTYVKNILNWNEITFKHKINYFKPYYIHSECVEIECNVTEHHIPTKRNWTFNETGKFFFSKYFCNIGNNFTTI